MRTTLALDDDVLAAARALAERERKSLGEVVSALVRQALRREGQGGATRNGIPLLPSGTEGKPVTQALVNRLRDDL